MKMTIITVGKRSDEQIQALIDDYSRRLKFKLEWVLIPNQNARNDIERIKLKESELIISQLNKSGSRYTILLDESGQMLSSPQLSAKLDRALANSLNLTFIIGGAYGVHQKLKHNVDFIWSLSDLVFPHQLVRLILTEQIYRAISISEGSSYHHA